MSVVPDAPPEAGSIELRASAIRKEAVRVLIESDRAESPIHYRAWLDLLVEQGYRITGKRPAAVFLNQIVRSPVVKSTTEAGVYELDRDVPKRLQAELGRLQGDLRRVSAGGSPDPDEVEKLMLEIRRAQRAMLEARDALGSDDQVPAGVAA